MALRGSRTSYDRTKNNLDVAGQRKTIVRKAAQFITQPLFLFSPEELEAKKLSWKNKNNGCVMNWAAW